MENLDSLNQVGEFHSLFGAPILDTPQIPTQRCELRVNLLQEELNELVEGIKNGDIVEVADALCDLQYVLSGAVLEFGLGSKFVELFNEVQRSNMSKACSSEDEAKKTVEFYLQKDGTESYIVDKGNKWLVYRKSDDKVLKSVGYSPANLKNILER
jgi:predicted HAD superfamily Cof-like phosphohydrolase